MREWFGICAKGPTDDSGLYQLYPRAAYYALKDAFKINPYDKNVDASVIRNHFDKFIPMEYVLKTRGENASLQVTKLSAVRISGLRLEFETYSTGGERITTPGDRVSGTSNYPAFLGFDHKQSFYAELESQPSANITAKMSLNILGHVPTNPIDEIFYENRGRPQTVLTPDEQITIESIERVKVYRASIAWEHPWFKFGWILQNRSLPLGL